MGIRHRIIESHFPLKTSRVVDSNDVVDISFGGEKVLVEKNDWLIPDVSCPRTAYLQTETMRSKAQN